MTWYAPMIAGRALSSARPIIDADVARWVGIVAPGEQPPSPLLWLLARYPEFRSLYCYRLKRGTAAGAAMGAVFAVLYPGERTLHLASSKIGPGLFIQHGFATIVAASELGANCWVNQQVTIGFDRPDARPVLGDNVSVHAGAKVLGAVHIGDGARIGANAVVREDVPAGYTAVGVPARLLPPKSQRTT
jgi:serine O-acetyltransferase